MAMQQLSGQDASFIYSERPHAPTHITSISIYDPSTAPGGKVTFKGILAHLERAAAPGPRVPPEGRAGPGRPRPPVLGRGLRVRPRVPRPPHRPAQAGRLAAVLHPGGPAARPPPRPVDARCGSSTSSRASTRSRGMPKGGFAIVLKVHHAAVDGKSGVEMISAIHSQSAEVVDPPPPAAPWEPENDPSVLELYGRASINALRMPVAHGAPAGRLVPGLGRAAAAQRANPDPSSTGMAPGTRFNGPVTAHRVLDARFFEFAAAQADAQPGARRHGQRRRAGRDRRGDARVPGEGRRAAGGAAAGDDAGVRAHRGGEGPISATRSRRWWSAWPPTSPTRRAARRRPPFDGGVQRSDPGRRRPQPGRAVPDGARPADRAGHEAVGPIRPERHRPASSTPSSRTSPDRASRSTSPVPARCGRSAPGRWSTGWG